MLVLMREQMNHVQVQTTKHWQKSMTTGLKTNFEAETNTSDVEKNQEIIMVIHKTPKMRQTVTCNWTKRILNKAS